MQRNEVYHDNNKVFMEWNKTDFVKIRCALYQQARRNRKTQYK